MESTFFRVTRDGPVAHLIMNRPDKANGMTPDFWADLPRLLDTLGQDMSVRVAVISGEGKHFTGGMDLSAFNDIARLFDNEPGRAAYAMRDMVLKLQDTINAVERARFPVIAAVHGACIGAGIDLITACDLRIAASDAYFAIEEIHIGMAADVGTLQRLPRLIADGIARELAYTGRAVDGQEAQRIGLVNQLFATPELLREGVRTIARSIAGKSPLAIRGTKEMLNYGRDHSVADGLNYIATWNAAMLMSADLEETMVAMGERRPPRFLD